MFTNAYIPCSIVTDDGHKTLTYLKPSPHPPGVLKYESGIFLFFGKGESFRAAHVEKVEVFRSCQYCPDMGVPPPPPPGALCRLGWSLYAIIQNCNFLI